MAKFDESKVINGLHPEKAEVGKKYWFSDNMSCLKDYVEEEKEDNVYRDVLDEIDPNNPYPFRIGAFGMLWSLLYPYEEDEQVQ